MGVTPLGALAGTRGGAGGVAPGDTWGHDGLVAVTPGGVGNACLSGTGVSVSRHHLSGLYCPWLAGAPGRPGRAATATLMGIGNHHRRHGLPAAHPGGPHAAHGSGVGHSRFSPGVWASGATTGDVGSGGALSASFGGSGRDAVCRVAHGPHPEPVPGYETFIASGCAVGGAGTAATDAGSAHHLDAARRVADDGARGGGGSGARYECGDSAARRTTHRGAGGCPWTRLPLWKGSVKWLTWLPDP